MIRHHRVFPGLSEDVPRARRFVAETLTGTPVADDAGLLASELATNAVLHTRSGQTGGSFSVTVEVGPAAVRVEVRDQGPRLPTTQPHRPVQLRTTHQPQRRLRAVPYDDGGRGLFIVEHLANRWGTAWDSTYHMVWFELDFKDPDDHEAA